MDNYIETGAEDLIRMYTETLRPRQGTTHGKCTDCGEETDGWYTNFPRGLDTWWRCQTCQDKKEIVRELWLLTFRDTNSVIRKTLLGI